MFERIDTERVFGQDVSMTRTGVRRRFVRRRICAFAIVVSLGAAITGPVAHAAGRGGGGGHVAPASRTYVVSRGDTLWSIASRISAGGDPRPIVAAIERNSHIGAADLRPGQTIFIPIST